MAKDDVIIIDGAAHSPEVVIIAALDWLRLNTHDNKYAVAFRPHWIRMKGVIPAWNGREQIRYGVLDVQAVAERRCREVAPQLVNSAPPSLPNHS